MDTLADIVQAVQDDFTVGEESALYSPTLIKRAINRAYRKAGALFPWPELMDAKKTSTQANQEYYDYPQTWRSNSIWKLTIEDSDSNDERYGESPDGSPLSFDDYLSWKEDYPDSTDKKWSHQWRRFFIWPIPTTTGSNNISVWGIMVTETLSDDSDVTIFSYSAFEGNEAIVLEAVAILKSKGEQEKAGEFRSIEAKQILTTYWRKIQKEMAKDEKNMPFFEVIDMFGTGTTSNQDLRGRFDIDLP